MKVSTKLLLCSLLTVALPVVNALADPDNPAIDMDGYLKTSKEAAVERQTHRLSEAEFIRMSKEPGTIILDARSATEFQRMHIEGATNLSFAEIDLESLKKKLPDKNTPILIYCDNNFLGGPLNNSLGGPLTRLTRQPRAALNLSTYIALYSYGYRNIYELAPLVDVRSTRLTLVPPPKVDELSPRPSSVGSVVTPSQPATPSLAPAATPQQGTH